MLRVSITSLEFFRISFGENALWAVVMTTASAGAEDLWNKDDSLIALLYGNRGHKRIMETHIRPLFQ